MFQYAVNRIFRKLAHENKEHAKNKRIRYKAFAERINAALVLCNVNKTHICHVWGCSEVVVGTAHRSSKAWLRRRKLRLQVFLL